MDAPSAPPLISPGSTLSARQFGTDPFSFSPPASPPRAPTGSLSGSTAGNECRLVEVRGLRVASFRVDGQELICLPQVFELFLKHLVGGLHTVYTKLKRLRARPVVCTVEQVRVLRGVGAIQPGVNRCKLISRRDFEALYNDCTSASSRPGRPPKRSYRTNMQHSSGQLLHHGAPGLIPPAFLSPRGLTAAAMAETMKLQKMKMVMNLHKSTNENGTETDPQELNSKTVSDLPFKMIPHPLLPVNLPRTSVALVMNQMNHLNTLANVVSSARVHSPSTRQISVIKECAEDSPSLTSTVGGMAMSKTDYSHKQRSSPPSSPKHANVHSPQSTSLNTEEQRERESGCIRFPKDTVEKCPVTMSLHSAQALVPGFPAAFLYTDGSSVETLLTNVQGLLKVALENARLQEKQLQQERRELKMELYREREIRESLERQLTTELHSRVTIQRRLRKEKKAKRRLQEALQFECKRREQVEQALQHTASHIFTHADNREGVVLNVEVEHNRAPEENSTLQERKVFTKTGMC
ncbi:dachshund b isoform X3 [Pygocentrus nattereri]|uniref:dachshund b isoform X3 n=1 Tax=Pygocentrus nattereri TaxID=42514 RepID=UPI000814A616|nr:dachshund b isoform X3 [Pygocentrus nattereri]